MTSGDTLRYGATLNVAPTVFPSATVNTSIPDEHFVPQLSKAKISSIEAGAGTPGVAGTYTATPQQIADLLAKYIWPTQAMGPEDQLSPFARTLQSGVGTIVQPSEPPVRFLGRRVQDPLGSGMTGWSSDIPDGSTDSTATTAEANGSAGGGNISAAPASPFATGGLRLRSCLALRRTRQAACRA